MSWATKSFPGAFGAGSGSKGGSGRHLATPTGTIYHVTNLDDSGPGSLRYGVESVADPRTIVFDVGGVIRLASPIRMTFGYMTIAGQTAPGRGVCLTDHGISFEDSNAIVRHIPIRTGDRAIEGYQTKTGTLVSGQTKVYVANTTGIQVNDFVRAIDGDWVVYHQSGSKVNSIGNDGGGPFVIMNKTAAGNFTGDVQFFRVEGGIETGEMRCFSGISCLDIMVDHCSAAWGVDSIFEMNNTPTNRITYQYCVFGEGLHRSFHTDGAHSKGMVIHNTIANGARFSVIRCFLGSCEERNPRINTPNGQVDLLQNIIYNPGSSGGAAQRNGINIANNGVKTRIIGNYLKAGPDSFTYKLLGFNGGLTGVQTYVRGNVGPGRLVSTQGNEWDITDGSTSHQSLTDLSFASETSDVAYMAAEAAAAHVKLFAGAHSRRRNEIDARLISEFESGTGGIINTQDDVEGYPTADEYPEVYRRYNEPSRAWSLGRDGYTRLENDLESLHHIKSGMSLKLNVAPNSVL